MPYVDLACVAEAGGLWYAFPQVGPLPLLLALAPWPIRLALTGRLTRRTPFDLPLVLFVITAALGVWAAYDRDIAWSKFWLILGAYSSSTRWPTPRQLAGIGSGCWPSLAREWPCTFWQPTIGSSTRARSRP
jgi:hypothetical protein